MSMSIGNSHTQQPSKLERIVKAEKDNTGHILAVAGVGAGIGGTAGSMGLLPGTIAGIFGGAILFGGMAAFNIADDAYHGIPGKHF